jgi:hypothetical protein
MRILIAALIVALTAVPGAAADGKYFARAEVDNDPTIPAQRAIVRFVNGEEVIVVESIVDSNGGELGWIVPVPSRPTNVQAMTPGTIETLDRIMAPRIETGGGWTSIMLLLGALAFLVALVCLAHVAKWSCNPIAVTLVVLMGIALVLFLMLPAVGRARGYSAVPGVEIVSAQRVGAYDTAVLQATAGEDVVQWLNDNEFRSSPESVATFDAYVRDGWAFVVAELAPGDGEEVQPHPLAITFATDEAVYPMRLTGVTTQPLQLDLFVIAAEEAGIDQLDTWRVERLTKATLTHALGHDVPGFESEASNLRIGHPSLLPLLFDGCTVTRLRGDLEPEDMATDFTIDFIAGDVRNTKLYTRNGALRLGALIALGFLPLVWLGSLAVVRRKEKPVGTFVRTAIAASVAVFGIVVLGSLIVLPTVQAVLTVESPIQHWGRTKEYHHSLVAYADDPAGIPLGQYMRSVDHFGALAVENEFIDVPGSCEVEPTDDGGWLAVSYDLTGAPAHYRITRFGKLTIDEQPEYRSDD